MKQLKVLIDGKAVLCNTDCKVIIIDEDSDCDLHVTMTHEGMVLDSVSLTSGPSGSICCQVQSVSFASCMASWDDIEADLIVGS